MKTPALAILASLVVSASLHAEEPLQIIGYPVPTLVVYDAQGEQVGELPRENMPEPAVPVLEMNRAGDLVRIAMQGGDIWLDPVDLQLNQGKTVQQTCRQMSAVSSAVDKQVATTMGYSTDCGDAK